MNEFLQMAASDAIENISIERGGEIAKAVTEYKYGVELTAEEAQGLWRTWCPGGKANAVMLNLELTATGSLAEFPKATHSQRHERQRILTRIANGPHPLHREPDPNYNGPALEEVFEQFGIPLPGAAA